MVFVDFFEEISILVCLLLMAMLPIGGCSHKLSNNNLQANSIQMDGGQDSGGGSAFKSAAEQVNGALDEALKLAGEPDPNKNIFVQFWLDKGKTSKHIFIQKPLHVFPNFDSSSSIRFMSPEFKAVSKNKLVRLTSGDCLNTATEVNKDASVSAHNLHAELCFSIGNLARIPPSSLLREVLSLVLHEATHMSGADEREAIAWQREFSNYFGARFGDLSDSKIIESTLEKLSDAKASLGKAQDLARKNPKNPLIYEAMGRVAFILGSLPDISDPLALELKLAPPSTGEIDNYMNSAQGLFLRDSPILNCRSKIAHLQDWRPRQGSNLRPSV